MHAGMRSFLLIKIEAAQSMLGSFDKFWNVRDVRD